MMAVATDAAAEPGCSDCGATGVELSSLGRCLSCIKAASDAYETRVNAENAQVRAQQKRGRRCSPTFGSHWVHGVPHTLGCVYHVAPERPPGAPSERGRAFSPENRLQGLCEAVRTAPEGQRNHMLNWAAYKAAEMVVSGELPREQVAGELVLAGLAAGLSVNEVGTGTGRGTVASGLRSGGA